MPCRVFETHCLMLIETILEWIEILEMFFCESCTKEVGVKTDIFRVIISIYSFSWKCKQFGKQLVLIANGEKQQLPEEVLLL